MSERGGAGDGIRRLWEERVNAAAGLLHDAVRALREEAARLVGIPSTTSRGVDDLRSWELRSAQLEFSSAVHRMASAEGTLRDRVRLAMADLVPFMTDRSLPDDVTVQAWQELVTSLPPGSDVALSDDDARRAAAVICDIDLRLRQMQR